MAGRRGDFLTSPEVGPLFGTVVARWIHHQWRQLGEPSDFTIVEVGAGPGTLARAIRSAIGDSFRYVAVEVSDAQRAWHPASVESVAAMPTEPFTGVVIANELLDNLPFRLVVWDGAWREAYVDSEGREVLARLADPAPPVLPSTATHGARAPLHDRAAAWVGDAQRLANRVLIADYCVATTAELARRGWRDWLRTYVGHGRGGHYLQAPGTQDITTEVCLDQLPPPETIATQADFLRRWGIDQLVDEGRAAWLAAAATPDVAALRMRSRINEADALLDPAGLGGFTIVEFGGHG